MRSITDVIRQFKQNWTEEIGPGRIADACRASGMTWIESMLNPVVTIQIFFLQVLHGNTACTHMPHLARMAFTAAAGQQQFLSVAALTAISVQQRNGYTSACK